jgi:coenzyme F420-reducing hydrogenase beta subunit
MIPAKITNLNPVQVSYTNILKPDKSKCFSNAEYRRMVHHYEFSKVIADVENVGRIRLVKGYYWIQTPEKLLFKELSLNQQVFIEPTTEGKCRIIKL